MRSRSTRLAFVLFLCCGFAWSGLAAPSSTRKSTAGEYYFHHDHILGTSLDLWVTADDGDAADVAEQAILAEIERLRRVFSLYDPASELSRLNQTHGALVVSRDLFAVLQQYEVMQARSHGAFHGQVGELVRVWKDAEKAQCEPAPATLNAIVQQLRQPGWQLDPANRTVVRLNELPLNLNAIAKGYIIQQASAAARRSVPELQGLLLNLGGDLAAWGADELGRPGFVVGVQDPRHPEDNAKPSARVRLRDRAMATSGGYERYYTIQGRRYSHLFDPRTGRSATGAASATVIAADNVTANALATTLCVLTPDEGLQLVAATPGAECLLVTTDGQQRRSAGFAALELGSNASALQDKQDKSDKKDAPAAPWPADFQVNVTLTLPMVAAKKYRRPYVAVWVENADAKPVRTITVWGNNPRWIKDLPQWWKFAKNDNDLVKAVSRATRAPGKYNLVWDGKDDQGNALSQGTYTIYVEVHREHGKLVRQSGKLTCAAEPVQLTLEKNAETEATLVAYAKKKAP